MSKIVLITTIFLISTIEILATSKPRIDHFKNGIFSIKPNDGFLKLNNKQKKNIEYTNYIYI